MQPLIPTNLLGTKTTEAAGKENLFTLNQRLGMSFGGVIRKGYTDWFSLETGINYTNRNFEARSASQMNGKTDSTRFGIVGYEIPVKGLVFVKLSDEIFMDVAFGLALDMFPSDVKSTGESFTFSQTSFRNSWSKNAPILPWLNTGLVANVGFEYRTDHSGYWYIGASYHRPFRPIYNTIFTVDNGVVNERTLLPLRGSYLTLDLKYFFHEEPEAREVKKTN
mgnify:CR=1 FL=1